MSPLKEPHRHTVNLTRNISAFPVMHGRAVFSLALRELLWIENFDCIALAFPETLQEDFKAAVEKLPHIYGLTVKMDGQTCAYLTIDPCDAYTEAVRQGHQRRVPVFFIEDDSQLFYRERVNLLDPHLVPSLGVRKYFELCSRLSTGFSEESPPAHRARFITRRLMELEKNHVKILLVCDFPLLALLERSPGGLSSKLDFLKTQPAGDTLIDDLDHPPLLEIKTFPVEPNHLYFALGELPFYAGELEKERFNPLETPLDPMALIKKIFIQTRDHHAGTPEESQPISTTRLQILLRYVRNLAVREERLIPDLFEVITGAKGVLGPYFAAKVLEAAKYYPFFDPLSTDPALKVGIDRIQPPDEDEPVDALNLLEDQPKYWKSITIKREGDKEKQKQYRYQWDPRSMCSHLPEDVLIENFNQKTRQKTARWLRDAHSRSEKFTSSIKDGLDIRETLRHHYKGEIYVKENPPVRRGIDTVVVIFDEDRDKSYPQRTTWYAEHPSESTLTFYATSPFENMVGPGVARAEYGGFSLLFPPRPVPNIFEWLQNSSYNLAEQLVWGACRFAGEKNISFLSFKRPSVRLRAIARKARKNLVWLPLTQYSQETLRKLRRFHILNGKEVRSWASRFIPE